MRQISWFFGLCLVTFPFVALANLNLSLQGVDDEVKANLNAYLEGIDLADYGTDLRYQSRLEKALTPALNALGYYQPQFRFQVTKPQKAMTLHIELGEVVRLQQVELQLEGQAKDDEDFQALLAKTSLVVGAPLNHGHYDALKSQLSNLALKKGYFDAHFVEQQLQVAPELHQAFVRLHYVSGERYRFGEVRVHGSQIVDERVLSLQPFQADDFYQVALIGQYQQNLSSTGWFSSISVEPDFDEAAQEKRLPLDVRLAPQSQNQLEVGLGYATDVGTRGSLKWKKPWLNELGHSLDGQLMLSKPEQSFAAGYNIPLDDVLRQYYRVQYGMKKVDNRDTKSVQSNLAIERHWVLDSGWQRTVFARYLIENYQQGVLDDVAHFVLPGVRFSRVRARRDGTFITWGDKQSVTLEYGDPALFSETRLTRVQASSAWVRRLAEHHRAVIRLDGGANLADEFDKVSPSLRFFAGGDNNLRGYGYQSISPRDSQGALAGAKFMVAGSLEYQYHLAGNWWGALFVDQGDAFDNKPDWKTGVGTGIRWISPIGPIRLDFAWGLDLPASDRFKIHFTLGPEL